MSEIYTISVDADGQPVQRQLAAMTADEVLQALAWHAEDAYRALITYEETSWAMTEICHGQRDPAGIEKIAQDMARSAIDVGRHPRLREAVEARLRQAPGYRDCPEWHALSPETMRLHWSDAAQSVS